MSLKTIDDINSLTINNQKGNEYNDYRNWRKIVNQNINKRFYKCHFDDVSKQRIYFLEIL